MCWKRTKERRRGKKVKLERERTGRGHAERSCLMRTLALLQIHNKKGRLNSAKIERRWRWGEDKKTRRKCLEDYGRGSDGAGER